MLKNGLLVGLFVALFYFISQYSKTLESKPVAEDDEEFVVRPVKSKRKPASVSKVQPVRKNSELYKPEFRETQKDDRNFAPEVERDERDEREVSSASGQMNYASDSGLSSSTRSYTNNSSNRSSSSGRSSSGGTSGASASGSTSGGASWGGGPPLTSSTGGTTGSGPSTPPPIDPPPKIPPSGGNTGDSNSLSCSANQGGGVYSNAILVEISCTASATIRYCISQGSCCDPSSGTTYTPGTDILLGTVDGDFCLSFEGESTSGGSVSQTVNTNYSFVSGAPNLQASHPKTFYQTTELTGLSYLTSNDFGKTNYGMGQVNFKTYDPAADVAANGCENTLDAYIFNPPVTPTPAPSIILSLLDLATVNPGSQIEIPLRPDHLDYGVNFVMSYLVDNTEATPNYVCSTQAITLEDFEFFTSEDSHGVAGTNQVREFSAGFSPYGFFEEEDSLYRGPAGVSGEDQSGQRLEAGLFEIFY